MKLRRLRIDRLEGIAEGFALENLDLGLTAVVGPNASGKTSICRAVRALLYPRSADGSAFLEAEFTTSGGRRLKVARQGHEVSWSEDSRATDPPLLPDARLSGCYTIELPDLLADTETDREINQRIAREMAGGYDLDSVIDKLASVGRYHARTEREELREAELRLREVGARHEEIRKREAELEELGQRQREARGAREEADACKRALALLEARRKLAACQAELAGFPPGMDRLGGGEGEELRRLRAEREGAATELAELDETASALETEREGLGLGDYRAEPADLAAVRKSLAELRDLEREELRVAADLDRAEGALRAALEELGGRKPAAEVSITPALLSEAEQDLVRMREVGARTAVIEAELRLLPGEPPDRARLGRLEAARGELMRWLSAPAPRAALGLKAAVVALAAAAAAAFGVAAETVHRGLWLGAVLVLAAAAAALREIGSRSGEREQARRRFEDCGIEGPERWTEESVRQCLGRLDAEVLELREALEKAGRRQGLERELEDLRRQAELCRGSLEALADRAGYDPARIDAGFDRWLRLVERYDGARNEVRELRGRLEGIKARRAELAARIGEFLECCPADPGGGETDYTALETRLAQVEERLEQRERLDARLDELRRARASAGERIRRLDEQIAGLFERLGLPVGADEELRRRLDLLEAWRKARDEEHQARGRVAQAEAQLGPRPELLAFVERGDEAALRKRLDEAERVAGAYEEVTREIAAIEKEVADARRGSDLEQARAARQKAADRLRDRLEEEWLAKAAEVVLGEVKREHADESRPPVLARAAEWFGRFTRHAFKLEFDRDRGLHAIETATGERRGLGQLSSGTRMQLLLAARLAFTMQAERGREPLPLFLDEALTTTDPERFRAVAAALAELAQEGDRQVFYLTAQPADVELLAASGVAPAVIDLGAVRRAEVAIRHPAELKPPVLPEVPSPEGMTPEQYAARIGAGHVRPFDPVESVHVVHLLRDDLELVSRLLGFGIERAGQLANLLESQAASVVCAGRSPQELALRIEIARAVLGAWRQGRGRPVDRSVLEEAGVSQVWLDRLASLCSSLGGDAAALVAALEERTDERAKGFQTKVLERVRAYLADEGYLDERPRLGPAEIRLRVLAAMADRIEAGEVTEDFVLARASDLLAAIPEE